ncbi:hypothetical protein FOCC_FOCC012892 [Frankliniella occidentalis]|uniref:Uncharacterized protein LOC127750516 n=1 Tax=Frankliniella occidentalis TaxID=133901 RepID=A0A9C6XRD3_FRAOC|nr:uncharacterized protein LOC127750516 [Frankliniella occidentalis]KAE8741599.1 hypothetical protein FOCC_FOCC012892 [Frankliniella occidentalis]
MLEDQMERDGITYLAGWVAYKHKDLPWLGNPTRERKNTSAAQLPSWVQQLSFGGLMEPSPEWLNSALHIEKVFQEFHKSEIYKGPNTVKKCVFKVMCEITSIPENVIKTYILQRTRIRIKFLNAYAFARKQEEKTRKEEEKIRKQEEKAKKEEEQKRIREEKAALKELKQRQREEAKVEREKQKQKQQDDKKIIQEQIRIANKEGKKRKLEEAKAEKEKKRQKLEEEKRKKQEEIRLTREEAKKRKSQEVRAEPAKKKKPNGACKAANEVVPSERKRARKMKKLTT